MRFEKSAAFHGRACAIVPGGVHSSVRANATPLPLTYARADGPRIWDIDGNEYIDYVLGQGPMLLGHTPRPVIEAVQRQAERGFIYAGQIEDELRAAEIIRSHVSCAEMVRFSTTGSEAVHAAIRLARAATGRKKIVRFEGHYHGWLDTIAWNQVAPGVELGPRESPPRRPSSAGQTEEDGANLLILPWNDLVLAEQLFVQQGAEIAGVICDPLASAAGLIPAQREFLHGLRRLCSQHGALMILDEVISGFRVGLSGAQGYYGVTPDLAVFAKALGAGMPVSAVVGKAAYMRLIGERKVVHSGTYNSNSLTMAGTVAALEYLTADDGAALGHAMEVGQTLIDGLKELSPIAPLPLHIRGFPTVFSVSFAPDDAEPITDYRSARQADSELLRRFWAALHERGVQITSFGIWFVSTAHGFREVQETLAAAGDALRAISARKDKGGS